MRIILSCLICRSCPLSSFVLQVSVQNILRIPWNSHGTVQRWHYSLLMILHIESSSKWRASEKNNKMKNGERKVKSQSFVSVINFDITNSITLNMGFLPKNICTFPNIKLTTLSKSYQKIDRTNTAASITEAAVLFLVILRQNMCFRSIFKHCPLGIFTGFKPFLNTDFTEVLRGFRGFSGSVIL